MTVRAASQREAGSSDGRTLAPLGRREVEISGCERLGAYVVVSAADPGGPRPDPGQFYMLAAEERWGGGADERPFLPRAFSVARAHDDGTLDFVLEAVGPGTERLSELRTGDGLWLLGPLGRGFTVERDRRAILVGGGVGIAPLAILADTLGAGALVLLGFRDASHAEGARLFTGGPTGVGAGVGAPARRGAAATVRVATDDGATGHRGTVLDLLQAELGCDPRATVYACGPSGMLEAVRALTAELGVPAQLALESGMACGYGACFGCVAPTRTGYVRLCVDGPVLDAADLERVVHD